MQKNIAADYFYCLPSGLRVHPFRLIVKDGSIMWKHALLYKNQHLSIPDCEAHESHIIKTAIRLEELNSWLSVDLEPWESLIPDLWYVPDIPELSEGIAVYMHHAIHPIDFVYNELSKHVLEHEVIENRGSYIFFKRC